MLLSAIHPAEPGEHSVSRGESVARLLNSKPGVNHPTLIGRHTIPFGWITICRRRSDLRSAGTLSMPILASDDTRQRDEARKRRYDLVITCSTSAVHESWNKMMLGAVADAGGTEL
jgi:hypothetical protein